ncbi:MAG: glycoside hydrolase family 2 [Ruminococcaceae bacterium]|nr:glycoside hydrolase family 2 [Oscillospiraceae bacterium]
MKTISLNGKWQLSGKPQGSDAEKPISLEGSVPGCVQYDLSMQGYLEKDIYMGENIIAAEKYESYEWWYERRFDAPDERKNVFLVFEGVDCLAEYFLNGIKIGESDNMFISHEFRIDRYIEDGENVLTVHIKSAVLEADREDYTLKILRNPTNVEGRHIRKAPHSYGWDIMPRLVTAGIWRDVKIEVRDSIYFSQFFFDAKSENCIFYYVLDFDRNDFEDVEIELTGSCGDDSSFSNRIKCRKKAGVMYFHINNVKKWFPYGYGDANVYDGTARIFSRGELVCCQKISFGVRSVNLERRDPAGEDDGHFRILINGIEIFCKGSNWVPLDAMHHRDIERYSSALELVKDIGCNILRCWGGNVYEDHEFFDFCDRNGIMVWQDFAMACASYPENEAFKKKLEKEAVSVIRKLRNHPSIIVWAGDNEVDSCTSTYNPDKNSLTRQVLSECVEQNDIGRPYLPSSPYITGEMYEKGERSQVLGSRLIEDHLWGPRDYFKSDFYKNNKAHFVSETGYHGCPSLDSIKRFISPDKVWPYSKNSEWILHSSDQRGNDGRVMLMEKQVRQLFGEVPNDAEEYILASQISQAEAKKYFIERMRVGRPEKTGIIWWNLLDGWPQMSDAVVDYYFTKKLAYYYIKRSQAPFTICADEIKNWNLNLYACNDTLEGKHGHMTVKDALTGEIIRNCEFEAKENASTHIASLPVFYSEHRILIFEWEINGERGFNHYLCGYPPISLQMYKEFLQKYDPINSYR